MLAALATFIVACAGWCGTVGEAKVALESSPVAFGGIITYLEPLECYVEARERSAGIRVLGDTTGLALGDPVAVTGTRGIVGGEPAVVNAAIAPGGPAIEIRPYGMRSDTIGGWSDWAGMRIWDFRGVRVQSDGQWVWERQWLPAMGASNTGLLVTLTGTAVASYYSPDTNTNWFYLDDGSGPVSDLGDRGVLVYSHAPVDKGDFVTVTGISSAEASFDDLTKLLRVVRTRSADDVRVLPDGGQP